MKLAGEYSAILLDSGNGWMENKEGFPRYLAFKSPEIILSSVGREVTVMSGGKAELLSADPLTVLDDYLRKGYIAVGYIGYEYSRYTVEGFSPRDSKDGHRFPDTNFLLYKPGNIASGNYQDLIQNTQPPDIIEDIGSVSAIPQPGHLCPNMTKAKYLDMVQAGRCYIERGDIYQVNLSQKMTAQFNLNPLKCFLDFYRVQSVPYGCYLNFGDFQLLSGSMELFLRKRGSKLTTKPIKGTIKRGKSDEIDTILKAKLISSDKERAENLMIVDLMRNDLGKVCSPGTVKVNKLFEVETYNTLHQMVSEVEGTAYENLQALQIVRSVFPPGSVTGAPKKRTLEVIDELEPHLRGPYCGAIGIFYPDGGFTLSVAIRIMTIRSAMANLFVGGGIVWDSDPEKEYEETLLKSEALTRAMGMFGN